MINLSELFADTDHRWQMGLQRRPAGEFFRPTARHETITTERKHWLKESPACRALLPEGVPLLDECVRLAARWGSLSAKQSASLAARDSAEDRCLRLGQMWEPDFLLLKADAAGRFQLFGGCVCFPSAWSLAEKIGRPLEFIHGPVPGLNAQLGRAIDAFLSRLAPDADWQRYNWGLSRSPELNQHPSRALPRLDASVTLSEVWLRVEQQALVALPESAGVLFGIRITMHPLTEVQRDAATSQRLAHALRTMPEPVAHYKGLAAARGRILAWLDAPG